MVTHRDGSVVNVSASNAVGCGFAPQLGHHKNGTNCPSAWHTGVSVEVWQCCPTV